MHRASTSACLVVVAALFAPALALGAPPPAATDEARAAAKAAAKDGVTAYEAGNYDLAIERFRRSDALYHAPQSRVYIARATEKLGRLVAARAIYVALLDEPEAPDASEKAREARRVAREELDALEKRIPVLAIAVAGVPLAEARATLDGAPIAMTSLAHLLVDPGEHTVIVSAEGGSSAKRVVHVDEGRSEALALTLEPAARSAGPQAPVAIPLPPPPARDAKGSLTPAFLGFGVGAAGLGVGAITGILALGKAADLAAACPTKRCQPADRAIADSASSLATVSTIGFVIGGVGAAAGIVFLVVRPSSTPASTSLRASLGPGTFALQGTF